MHVMVPFMITSEISDSIDQQAGRKTNASNIDSSFLVLVLHLLNGKQYAINDWLCAGRFFLFRYTKLFDNKPCADIVKHIVEAISQVLRQCSNVVINILLLGTLQWLGQEQVE